MEKNVFGNQAKEEGEENPYCYQIKSQLSHLVPKTLGRGWTQMQTLKLVRCGGVYYGMERQARVKTRLAVR